MSTRQVQIVPKDSQERNSLDVSKNSASILAREDIEKVERGLSTFTSFSNMMTRLVDIVKHLLTRDALHSKRLESLEQEIENLKAQMKTE